MFAHNTLFAAGYVAVAFVIAALLVVLATRRFEAVGESA
jgi:hypothetical protein